MLSLTFDLQMNSQEVLKLKKILYVEDDPDDREIFVAAIQMIDPSLTLETAIDGTEALEKLKTTNFPSCIYIDINMPKMNGIELLKSIKANPVYATIPAFIFSTAENSFFKTQAQKFGAAEYLIKPTTFEGLINLLKSCFATHFPLVASH
jgi:CheY-like chemotaxis protein